jgi:hypothetical protein
MSAKINLIINGNQRLQAELNDSPTAKKLSDALPMELSLSRWGDEYYGACGVKAGLGDGARTRMAVGEIAYWPPGNALCLFFGPTPASSGSEPEAASEVNPVGRIVSDCAPLKTAGGSIKVRIEREP